MELEYDIAFSYHLSDNTSPQEDEKGWVSNFQHFLKKMYNQLFGAKLKFVKLSDQLKATKEGAIKPRILICVLSPTYVASPYCIQEVEHFNKLPYFMENEWDKTGIYILKVMKAPVPSEEQPLFLKSLLGYDLFHIENSTGNAQEITDFFGTDASKSYWLKLADLAYDIHELITSKACALNSLPLINNPVEKGAIYLAETSQDLLVQRHIIKRELQRHGYKVLPNQSLPTSVKELERVVRQDLAVSKLSIHLIGDSYGEVPEGSRMSVIDLQNKLAAEHSRALIAAREAEQYDPAFRRLIWVAPEIKGLDEKQKDFINEIRRTVESIESAEILQTPLEDFKSIIRDELGEEGKGKNGQKAREINKKPSKPVVYLIFDKIDTPQVQPIMKLLSSKGFKVILPLFQGDLLKVRQVHIENLRKLDIAIIYKGQINERWLQMKALDLVKAPGYGRSKPILHKIIVIGEDAQLDVSYFFNKGFTLTKNPETDLLDLLKDFFSIHKEDI